MGSVQCVYIVEECIYCYTIRIVVDLADMQRVK